MWILIVLASRDNGIRPYGTRLKNGLELCPSAEEMMVTQGERRGDLQYAAKTFQERFGNVREGVCFKLSDPNYMERDKVYRKFWRGRWPMGVCLDKEGQPVRPCSSVDGTLVNPTPLTWVVIVAPIDAPRDQTK